MKTKRIKMTTSCATPVQCYEEGEEYDIEERLAGDWIESGVAEAVKAKRTRKKKGVKNERN